MIESVDLDKMVVVIRVVVVDCNVMILEFIFLVEGFVVVVVDGDVFFVFVNYLKLWLIYLVLISFDSNDEVVDYFEVEDLDFILKVLVGKWKSRNG